MRSRDLLHVYGLGTSRHVTDDSLGGNGSQKGVPRDTFIQDVRHFM